MNISILTEEEVRVLNEGLEQLNKSVLELKILDFYYLIGYTKLNIEKVFNFCLRKYEVEKIKTL